MVALERLAPEVRVAAGVATAAALVEQAALQVQMVVNIQQGMIRRSISQAAVAAAVVIRAITQAAQVRQIPPVSAAQTAMAGHRTAPEVEVAAALQVSLAPANLVARLALPAP